MSLKDIFWTEKYKPKTLDTYIFHDNHLKIKIQEIINKEKQLPHILLTGVRGTGKTTIADILLSELQILDADIMVINASDENSVDVIREKIKNFSKSAAMGEYKVVLLDECDFISQNGQAALRKTMVDYADNCRFLLTANYAYKLLPEIVSRCTYKFDFKAPDKNDITELLITILSKEKVGFELETIDQIVDQCYPDIRSCINMIQEYSSDGKLQPVCKSTVNVVEYKSVLLDYIDNNDWVKARKLVCENVVKEEYEDVYRFLYDNLHTTKKFSIQDNWDNAVLIIADHMDKHSRVCDPEINCAAMFINLGQIG